MMNNTISKFTIAITIAVLANQIWAGEPVNEQWQQCMLQAVSQFPTGGGYYTGSKPNSDFPITAWRALNEAYAMEPADPRPNFNAAKAQPSFCSIATYSALIKALLMWDTKGKIPRQAWINMKPYVGIVDRLNTDGLAQDDGMGFWGRCNANGPAIGTLVHELKAGISYTGYRGALSEQNKETPAERYMTDAEWESDPVWSHALPGDIMKIFWNRNDSRHRDGGAIIGYDGIKSHDQEAGHSVIFLGYDPDGSVRYWSSNGPSKTPKCDGYGIGHCKRNDVQRVVITRILKPQNFDRVKKMPPTHINKYLYDLNGKRHSTTAELKKQCGIR